MARSKTGPPYSGRSAEYVVVTYPWGMNRDSRKRDFRDFDRLGAWIQYVLREKDIQAGAECIYTMGTRDDVIVQLPYGTNIQPLLGEHKWSLIANKWEGDPNDSRASCLFEYNFRNNGDPGNHNWAEQYPNPLPHGQTVPAKSPYPAPGWTEPPNSIRGLVLPIPPRPPPVIPEPEPTQTPAPAVREPTLLQPRTPVSVSPANDTSESVFRPYEPPTQHPAHGTFINQTNQPRNTSADHQSLQTTPPAKGEHLPNLKYIKKLDPYQEEEETQALLRIPPRDTRRDPKPIKQEPVKREPTDTGYEPKYQPSSELMDAIDSLIQGQNEEGKVAVHDGLSITAPLRSGPSAASYQPSAELVDAIDSLIQEQDLDQKPLPREASRHTRDPRQTPHYQPSAELTNAINSLLQQSTVSEEGEERKPALDPRRAYSPLIIIMLFSPSAAQKRRKVVQGGHPGTERIKLENV
ncbi:hypothetical protein M405DRAFT_935958 [Rhizopogon salebrosus TDB-379]|nr:hypothetical protein M405DRAFT_935958 [Rhizopogon salebrosus TDB-379]